MDTHGKITQFLKKTNRSSSIIQGNIGILFIILVLRLFMDKHVVYKHNSNCVLRLILCPKRQGIELCEAIGDLSPVNCLSARCLGLWVYLQSIKAVVCAHLAPGLCQAMFTLHCQPRSQRVDKSIGEESDQFPHFSASFNRTSRFKH